MAETLTKPDVRVNLRVPSELFSRLQRFADERYEGRISMAAREAFRIVFDESAPTDNSKQDGESAS